MTDIFTKKAVIILVAVSIFLSFLPALRLLPLAESSTFFEAFTTNYSYYFARIHEIADGKPFIGNPYFFEHKDEPSVAFFGADWVASVPVLVGLPFGLAMYLNLLFWLCIFSEGPPTISNFAFRVMGSCLIILRASRIFLSWATRVIIPITKS